MPRAQQLYQVSVHQVANPQMNHGSALGTAVSMQLAEVTIGLCKVKKIKSVT